MQLSGNIWANSLKHQRLPASALQPPHLPLAKDTSDKGKTGRTQDVEHEEVFAPPWTPRQH